MFVVYQCLIYLLSNGQRGQERSAENRYLPYCRPLVASCIENYAYKIT